MATPYANRIAPLAPQFDPRHVEAYMRSEHSTLDGLSPSQFRTEVTMACECIRVGGFDMAERIARSFGL